MTSNRPIVIVEDSDEDFEAMMWIWRRAKLPLSVVRCKNGEDALDRLLRNTGSGDPVDCTDPAVIILDLNLPGTDGRSLLQRIKQDQRLCVVPVVVLTTSSNPKDVSVCYRSGANSYILKPPDLFALQDILTRVVSYWTDLVCLPPLSQPSREASVDSPKPHDRV